MRNKNEFGGPNKKHVIYVFLLKQDDGPTYPGDLNEFVHFVTELLASNFIYCFVCNNNTLVNLRNK